MSVTLFFILSPEQDKSQQVSPEAFLENMVLENFIDRTVRSSSEAFEVLQPATGDTLFVPIRFLWQHVQAGEYHLTIVDNKNVTVWETTTASNEVTFKDALTPGLYYWKLQADERLVAVRRFYVID